MFISHVAKTTMLLAATTSIASFAFNTAYAADRQCKYEVRVKADGIGSVTIPNGNIVFQGKAVNTNNNRGFARFHAADAATECIAAAIRGGQLPRKCRSGIPLRSNSAGRALNFNLQNAKTIAYNTLCRQSKNLGRNNADVRNAQIYTYVLSGSIDVRRECALPAKAWHVPNENGAAGVPQPSRYKTWHRKNAVRCRNGNAQ